MTTVMDKILGHEETKLGLENLQSSLQSQHWSTILHGEVRAVTDAQLLTQWLSRLDSSNAIQALGLVHIFSALGSCIEQHGDTWLQCYFKMAISFIGEDNGCPVKCARLASSQFRNICRYVVDLANKNSISNNNGTFSENPSTHGLENWILPAISAIRLAGAKVHSREGCIVPQYPCILRLCETGKLNYIALKIARMPAICVDPKLSGLKTSDVCDFFFYSAETFIRNESYKEAQEALMHVVFMNFFFP